MHRTRAIVAFILIAAGLVWIGQGSGVLKGSSFMVGDVRWAWIGAAVLAAGLVVGWLEIRTRRA
ncbi:MAG TPA: hypothetical protein VFJ71_07465 [Candidatus Limnocylindrales bacterium]|nr:hypothetical protein [Candidatus Limnocylindrales bacterium]